MRVAVAKRERLGRADVQVVREPLPVAVVGKLGVFDQHLACSPRQDAVFVVMKIAVPDCQVVPFQPDPGAVLVGHAGAGELDVFDHRVVAVDHPDAFAVGVGARRIQFRPAVYASQREPVFADGADIARVRRGVDFDDVAGGGGRDGPARRGVRLRRTHPQDSSRGGPEQRDGREHAVTNSPLR